MEVGSHDGLNGRGVDFEPGDLLLAGPGRHPWHLRLQPIGTYGDAGRGLAPAWYGPDRGLATWDAGAWLLYPNGIELRKAPQFTSQHPPVSVFDDSVYLDDYSYRTCVNADGEVVRRARDTSEL